MRAEAESSSATLTERAVRAGAATPDTRRHTASTRPAAGETRAMATAVPTPTMADTPTGSTVLTRRLPTSSTSAPVRAMRSPRRNEARWSLREAARAS